MGDAKETQHESERPKLGQVTLQKIRDLFVLAFFGVCGALARQGLINLTGFENAGTIWPNATGCLIIGLQASIVGPTIAALSGVGLCGALTSFSTYMTNLFNYASTPQDSWPNYGWAVPYFIHRLLIELSVSLSAYQLGKHMGTLVSRPIVRETWEPKILFILSIAGALSWIAVVVVAAAVPSKRDWPLIGVFSPLGVWCRYWLMPLNRPVLRYGTITSNMLATIIASVLWICMQLDGVTPTQQVVMVGLSSGFCGAFSTISSFVVELCTLRTRHAYIYGILSLAVGFSLCVIIMGSYKWTR